MKLIKELKSMNRLGQIVAVSTKYGFGYLINSNDLEKFIPFNKRFLKKNTSDRDSIGPKTLKKALEELGGAFIKLGQILSLRPDLIPIEYCNELSKLQDNVKPLDYSIVKDVIESELKKPINKIFRSIRKEAVGSGSVAQIHEAELFDGTKVAVKVQRPHIKDMFWKDIYLMYKLAKIMQKNIKGSNIDLVRIVTEFEEYSKKELNFFREVKNIKRSYDNFENYPNVRIPKVYFEYCTEKIIVMDYMEGTKLAEIDSSRLKFDKKKIAAKLIDIYLKESLEDGFFHADLHPGNIMIHGKNNISLLDFGIFGSIENHLRSHFTRFLKAVMEEDTKKISEVMLKDFDTEYGTISIESFQENLEDVMVQWKAQTANGGLFTNIIMQIVHLATKSGIKMPHNMVLFSKGFYTIEGTCLELNPKMNFMREIKRYFDDKSKQGRANDIIKKMNNVWSIWQQWAEDIPDKAGRILNQLDKGLLRFSIGVEHNEVDYLKKSINQIANRLIIGCICASLLIASSLLINVTGARIFGISWLSFAGFITAGMLAVKLIFSNNK